MGTKVINIRIRSSMPVETLTDVSKLSRWVAARREAAKPQDRVAQLERSGPPPLKRGDPNPTQRNENGGSLLGKRPLSRARNFR